MSLAEVARIWQQANVSVIPILTNQTKRPAFRWSPYQVTIPTLGEVNEWWGNGKAYGLALICGAVSGNLEMTEVEGRACTGEALTDISVRMDELGAGHIWDLLNGPEGYSEMSPSGGLHLLYRISDHEVPGNTKIANDESGLVLAETRGHGGYVIVAPTPGICHPSGESWSLLTGNYGQLPSITWTERNLLHRALQLALGVPPPPPEPVLPLRTDLAVRSNTPGDDFEAHTDWAEILEPHGWSLESRHGTERHWTRPGKERREGASATTGRAQDRDRLYVFSTSTVFESEVPYTKFGAYALLNHNGDHSAAARELARRGFGEQRTVAIPDLLGEVTPELLVEQWRELSDSGNAEHLWERVKERYHYVHQWKEFITWTGRLWKTDHNGQLCQEFLRLTRDMHAYSVGMLDTPRQKWAIKSQDSQRVNGCLARLRTQPGCTVGTEELDVDRHLLNVGNGILDLGTRRLTPHDPSRLLTRMFGASYDEGARCVRFEEFVAAAVPDDDIRKYIQRSLGYSLLGSGDQRSIFWIYGPPGTGKSTLMDTIRGVFGDYGATAAASAFRAKERGTSGPNNDLHVLRGKRFVTTSETTETTSFDEDLLKRLSGRDQVTSRTLYQENQEWTPECVLWMATNNAPRFSSDDDAIWRRTKLVPFLTTFVGKTEITDFSRTVLLPERDGILMWLLEGLADYRAQGLGEPGSVAQAARTQRIQSDSVARFIDEGVLDGVLCLGEAQLVRARDLYLSYVEWARQAGERAIGSRRFTLRVVASYPEIVSVTLEGYPYFKGVGKNPLAGAAGLLAPNIWDR